MPHTIDTRPDRIRLDNHTINADAIRLSPSIGDTLEAQIKTALATPETLGPDWTLHIHVTDKATANIGILVARTGSPPSPPWWAPTLHPGEL